MLVKLCRRVAKCQVKLGHSKRWLSLSLQSIIILGNLQQSKTSHATTRTHLCQICMFKILQRINGFEQNTMGDVPGETFAVALIWFQTPLYSRITTGNSNETYTLLAKDIESFEVTILLLIELSITMHNRRYVRSLFLISLLLYHPIIQILLRRQIFI